MRVRIRAINVILIGVFLAAMLVPLSGLFFASSSMELVEKRRLAELPPLRSNLAALIAYPKAFEAFFDDHLGFRRQLVQGYNWAKLSLGVSPSPLAMVGRDGWHFFASEAVLNSAHHRYPFSFEHLLTWQMTLEARRDWLAARGIRYLFVVVPNKHTVYPEYLPAWFTLKHPDSRLDQFIEHMAKNSDVQILDLRGALAAAKGERVSYRKTDTHWNDYGAFVGARALTQRLKGWFSITPLSLDRYALSSKISRGGGLAGLYDLRDRLTEAVPVLTPMFSPCAQPRAVPLSASLHWNREEAPIGSECARADGPGTVMFRDSFATAMVPFLSESFSKISYIWKPYDHAIMTRLIAADAPKLVVEEMVERHFFQRVPHLEGPLYKGLVKQKFDRSNSSVLRFSEPTGRELTASPSGGALVFAPFKVAKGDWLVGRALVFSPQPSRLWLSHRQGEGDWRRDPLPLVSGGNEVYFHLPLTDTSGQVALMADAPGQVVVGLELRAVPVNSGG